MNLGAARFKATKGGQVSRALRLRGGEVEMLGENEKSPPEVSASFLNLSALTSSVAALGKVYNRELELRPIITKSWTAAVIFALSDYFAQRIERSKEEKPFDQMRLVVSTLVGALYFAPAAHYWYNAIFYYLPGKGLVSTVQKAVLGQLVFGPVFTCVFFAASLIQTGTFSFANWGAKIRSDLPGAWLAGSCFWPFVDLISYSLVPINLIPLFINLCSLVWTIYLSLVSNQGNDKSA
eukprot:scaffold3618_cov129-Cylindrotheca_fusiformis.AAC.10